MNAANTPACGPEENLTGAAEAACGSRQPEADENSESRFARTELLYGKAAVSALGRARVAVFGLGGVGGHVVEALARSGVGELDLIDHDRVTLSNLNRQIIATEQTLGLNKVDAAEARVHVINPVCRVTKHRLFFLPETAGELDFTQYDYIVDAVDNVTAKLTLAEKAQQAGVPLISAMGTGNKLEPSKLRVADIYETSVCPLARVMRKECRKRGISALKVVYSTEVPAGLPSEENPGQPPRKAEEKFAGMTAHTAEGEAGAGADSPGSWTRATPASNAVVPAVAGLLMASEVLKDLTQKYR